MERIAAKIIIILPALLFLVACGGEVAGYPGAYEANDYVLVEETEGIEFEVEEQDIEDELAVEDIEEDIMEDKPESLIDIVNFVPPTMEISEYGKRVAIEFLSEMTTIFTGMPRAETAWDETQRIAIPTGRFWTWDRVNQQRITTDEPPEFYFLQTYGGEQQGFFDKYGNQLYGIPWLSTPHEEGWPSFHYAGYFRLFDFDCDGIPEIFIHFSQTLDGSYVGFYRIFRYVDGEYRMLEMRTLKNAEESPWPWFGSLHELFWDDNGRIITFIDTAEYNGIAQYEHLVIVDEYAELHLVVALDYVDWDAWREYHWREWGRTGLIGGWSFESPTIFGTDIPLTPIQSLTSLENEITAIILKSLD